MLRVGLIAAIIVQIIIAINSDGLLRSLMELSAFVSTLGLVLNIKLVRRAKSVSQAREH